MLNPIPIISRLIFSQEAFNVQDDRNKHATLEEGYISSSSQTAEIRHAAELWPFAPSYLTTPALAAQLIQHLPTLGRATALTEAYFTNLSWFCEPISRDQVTSELLPLFYSQSSRGSLIPDHSKLPSEIAAEHPHELALLFAVFAFGAVADLTLPAENAEATKYCSLSRAALGLRNVFNGGSFIGCQAICLLAIFQLYDAKPSSQENGWTMLSLGMGLASSVSTVLLRYV